MACRRGCCGWGIDRLGATARRWVGRGLFAPVPAPLRVPPSCEGGKAQRFPCAARQGRRPAELAAPARLDLTWSTSDYLASSSTNWARQSSAEFPSLPALLGRFQRGSKAAPNPARFSQLAFALSRIARTTSYSFSRAKSFPVGFAMRLKSMFSVLSASLTMRAMGFAAAL